MEGPKERPGAGASAWPLGSAVKGGGFWKATLASVSNAENRESNMERETSRGKESRKSERKAIREDKWGWLGSPGGALGRAEKVAQGLWHELRGWGQSLLPPNPSLQPVRVLVETHQVADVSPCPFSMVLSPLGHPESAGHSCV